MPLILTDNLQRWERFVFFTISDLTQFRKDLDTFAPIITSSTQTAQDLEKIHTQGKEDLDIVSHGIAFSKAGLKKLNVLDKLGDPHFDQGSLVIEKKQIGDMEEYDTVFASDGNTHGVILITAGGKLDFVAFRPQTAEMSFHLLILFLYRTRHMQDEDRICHRNYIQELYHRRDFLRRPIP